MAITLKIVDKIDAAPTTGLDLNDGTTWGFDAREADFSPPKMREGVSPNVMGDGSLITNMAYENRILKLPLVLRTTTEDLLATELQKLSRELDRARNLIMYQPNGLTKPVFFRTLRSPDYAKSDQAHPNHIAYITLLVRAEPFAYGLRVDQGQVTLNNNPAHATNGMYIDITGVTGEVPTPGYILLGNPPGTGKLMMGIRRHGTPPAMASNFFRQCEDFTSGTDTAGGGQTDAAMSGAGNPNFKRTTFVTTTEAERLFLAAFPAAGSSVEWRGEYKLLVRLRKSVAGDSIKVRAKITLGSLVASGDQVTLPSITGPFLVDCGTFALPGGWDPEEIGYSGQAQAVTGARLGLFAERVSGSGTLDWDYALLVPADEEMCVITKGAWSNDLLLDGPNNAALVQTLAATSLQNYSVVREGGLPLLAPNQTNRLIVARNVEDADAVGDTLGITVSFWPRFLNVRA